MAIQKSLSSKVAEDTEQRLGDPGRVRQVWLSASLSQTRTRNGLAEE